MKIEPHADFRSIAASLWQVYTALMDVGFDKEQALQLTIVLFNAGTRGEDS